MTLRRDFVFSALLITCAASAHAQDSEVALFYWAALGGATFLLLGLIGWFLFTVFRKSDRQNGKDLDRRERVNARRLGE